MKLRLERSAPETTCSSGKRFYNCENDGADFSGTITLARESTLPARARRTTRTSTLSSEDEEEGTSTQSDEKPSRTMTDSGTTRTIPNPNRVTVTRHTLIITDKAPVGTPTSSNISSSVIHPSSLPSSGSTGFGSPAQTSASDPFAGGADDGSPSTGAIVGAAVGGAVALAILTVLVVAFLRRRKLNREESGSGDGQHSSGEKNYYQGVSRHTTGTRESHDPFAPFGGRADRADDPLRPPSGTFEMDGTSTAPVELPAVKFSDTGEEQRLPSHPSGTTAPYRYPVQVAGPTDPRANLNASTAERLQKTYVNHWNQYRSLGQGGG
ncbi:hypothetical protein ACJ41O_002742 [Fusarium nematophilum]